MKKVFMKTFGWSLETVLHADFTCLPAGRHFLEEVYSHEARV